MEVTLEQQIECVERELAMRRRVYPRWVNAAKPKMTPAKMELELARMEAVLATLKRLQAQQDTPAP